MVRPGIIRTCVKILENETDGERDPRFVPLNEQRKQFLINFLQDPQTQIWRFYAVQRPTRKEARLAVEIFESKLMGGRLLADLRGVEV